MNCLVVVDAWKHCEKEDVEKYPWLEKETKLFGSFLDLQLQNIKQRYSYDIIHCAGGRDIMDEIKTRDIIINNIKDIPAYNFYFFCGFHLGRCINTKINEIKNKNCGIVHNLSMVFPEDSYIGVMKKYSYNYLYSYNKGFEKCNMNC